MTENPFKGPCYSGHQCYEQTAEGRILMVKDFDAEQCEAALAVPGLQKTVASAVRTRQRKLCEAVVKQSLTARQLAAA